MSQVAKPVEILAIEIGDGKRWGFHWDINRLAEIQADGGGLTNLRITFTGVDITPADFQGLVSLLAKGKPTDLIAKLTDNPITKNFLLWLGDLFPTFAEYFATTYKTKLQPVNLNKNKKIATLETTFEPIDLRKTEATGVLQYFAIFGDDRPHNIIGFVQDNTYETTLRKPKERPPIYVQAKDVVVGFYQPISDKYSDYKGLMSKRLYDTLRRASLQTLVSDKKLLGEYAEIISSNFFRGEKFGWREFSLSPQSFLRAYRQNPAVKYFLVDAIPQFLF